MRWFDLPAVLIACLVALPAQAAGYGEPTSEPLVLSRTHTNGSETIRFRTPLDWAVQTRPGEPETTEARGGGVIVRLVRRQGELGLDSTHVECMLLRLADGMQARPNVDYEYDFVGGSTGARRGLDSAFVVHYDEPIDGSRDWRQRNLTLVGGGESICVVGYAPLPAWKRSKQLRKLFDAVLGSVEFKPWR